MISLSYEQSSTVSMQAFAKINVHLSIGPRMPDGYHALVSVFLLIGLSDAIELSAVRSDKFSCSIDGVPSVGLEQNTMFKIAKVFCDATGIPLEVKISCVKRIPSQAGLGGGSSDAASILLSLDLLCETRLCTEKLLYLASCVGSDVPFFASGKGAALVEGRGERIKSIPPREDLFCLLVMPRHFSHSTSSLFAILDRIRSDHEAPVLPDAETLASALCLPCDSWPYSNDFRVAVGSHEQWYASLDKVAQKHPGCFGGMTGSGSAYVFVSENSGILGDCEHDLAKISLEASLFRTKCLHGSETDATLRLW